MSSFLKKVLLPCCAMLLSHPSLAHTPANPVREFLSHINFRISGGFGMQSNEQSNQGNSSGIQNQNEDTIVIEHGTLCTGSAFFHPMHLLRIGLGCTVSSHSTTNLENNDSVATSQDYKAAYPFFTAGTKLFEKENIAIWLELNAGGNMLFDNTWKHTGTDNRGKYELAFTVEQQVSEYMKAFLKSSGYVSTDANAILNTKKDIGGLSIEIGLDLCIPDAPRCPVPGCKIKDKHWHGGKVYHGHTLL